VSERDAEARNEARETPTPTRAVASPLPPPPPPLPGSEGLSEVGDQRPCAGRLGERAAVWQEPESPEDRETVGHAWAVERALFESSVLGVVPGPVHPCPASPAPLGHAWSFRLGEWVDASRLTVEAGVRDGAEEQGRED